MSGNWLQYATDSLSDVLVKNRSLLHVLYSFQCRCSKQKSVVIQNNYYRHRLKYVFCVRAKHVVSTVTFIKFIVPWLPLWCYGNREVYNGQHTGAGQRQVAVSAEWKEVQRTRVCAQAYSYEACGKTGWDEKRGKFRIVSDGIVLFVLSVSLYTVVLWFVTETFTFLSRCRNLVPGSGVVGIGPLHLYMSESVQSAATQSSFCQQPRLHCPADKN